MSDTVSTQSGNAVPEKRHCTDSGWILSLILVWTLVAVIATCSLGVLPSNFIQSGSKLRLYGVMDYHGMFCGIDKDVVSLPYLWLPNENGLNYNNQLLLVPSDVAICVNKCPSFDEAKSDPYGALGAWNAQYTTVNVAGVCRNIHSRLPGDLWRSVWVDVDLVWIVIVIGSTALPIILVLIIVIAYLTCFGNNTSYLKWLIQGCLWKVCFVLLVGGGMLVYDSYQDHLTYDISKDIVPKSNVEVSFQRVTGIIMFISSILWMMMISTVSTKRIEIAFDLLFSLTLLLKEQPLLLFPPLLGLYSFVELSYYTYFLGIHIASSSTIKINVFEDQPNHLVEYQVIEYNKHTTPYLYTLLILYLWSSWIINAFTQLVQSSLVWRWYSISEPENTAVNEGNSIHSQSELDEQPTQSPEVLIRRNLTIWDVYNSYAMVVSNHIGTAAAGSIFIHVLFPIRMILRTMIKTYLYFTRTLMNNSNATSTSDKSPLHDSWQYWACCCNCYAAQYIFKSLRSQNNNAYVICAYKGHPYKKASIHADRLLRTFMNKGKYILSNVQLVFFIINIAISIMCAMVAYSYIYNTQLQLLHEFISIPWIIAITSFFIINLGLQSMYILLATLMIAYILDEQLDYGRGAKRLPLLHLMFIQLYNHAYADKNGAGAAGKRPGPLSPIMDHPMRPVSHHPHDMPEDMSSLSSHVNAHQSGFPGSALDDDDEEGSVSEDEEPYHHILDEYIGIGEANTFVYTPMTNEDRISLSHHGSIHTIGTISLPASQLTEDARHRRPYQGIGDGLSSLSAMTISTVNSNPLSSSYSAAFRSNRNMARTSQFSDIAEEDADMEETASSIMGTGTGTGIEMKSPSMKLSSLNSGGKMKGVAMI